MPSRISAGLVMFRRRGGRLEVFLAHPGGPLFVQKDDGHWTIPKGEAEPDEELLPTAIREFGEETGITIDPGSPFIGLGTIVQKGSNTFEMEWPPGSGRLQSFPEVDRARYFPLEEARRKLKERQVPLLDRLESILLAAGG
jgi:predicted NUDIX family NTP pyrophosphohydrolase